MPARARATAAGFDDQRRLAASLQGATEDIKWGADLVYSVGGKMFCVFLMREGVTCTCSFKVDDERFLELTGVPGVKPAPYLARSMQNRTTSASAARASPFGKISSAFSAALP